jgi:hypothetical protein
MSIHPVITDAEMHFIIDAIEQVALNYAEWKKDYVYEPDSNEYHHQSKHDVMRELVNDWFEKSLS